MVQNTEVKVLEPLNPVGSNDDHTTTNNEVTVTNVEPLEPSPNEEQTPVTVSDVEPSKPVSTEGQMVQNTEVKVLEPLNPVGSNDDHTTTNNEETVTAVEPTEPSSNEEQTPATVSDVKPSKPVSTEGQKKMNFWNWLLHILQNTEVKHSNPLNPAALNVDQTAANHEQNVTEPPKPSTSSEEQALQNTDTQVTPPESSRDLQLTANTEVKATYAEPLKPAASNEQEVPRENENDVELKDPTTLVDGQLIVQKMK